MAITITPSDGTMYVDGEAQTVDMADMPSYVHAIQWNGTDGEVEFKTDANGKRLPNLKFTDFAPLQFMVTRWEASKQVADNQMTLMQQQQAARDEQLAAAREAQASMGTEKLL